MTTVTALAVAAVIGLLVTIFTSGKKAACDFALGCLVIMLLAMFFGGFILIIRALFHYHPQ